MADVLEASDQPLWQRYDLAVLDLDGVVYVGKGAVPHAADALSEASSHGMHLAFVTNNASRPPERVAAHLTSLGVTATAADVVTSAQALASVATAQLAPGSKVFLIGGEGLDQALRERGFEPVTERSDDVVAVAQGYGPQMPWSQVMAGALLVKDGLPWLVSNTDMTVPTPHGMAPGNGALVKLVADYSGCTPNPAGKPARPLFDETLARVPGVNPLMIGDRLDTDIEGARNVDWPALLVLTGVTGVAELVAAPPQARPSYIGLDLRCLGQPHPAPVASGASWQCGGWTVQVTAPDADNATAGRAQVSGAGEPADWWRALVAAAWEYLDRTGEPCKVENLHPPAVT